MRAADNESLRPSRALLPHSSSQIGSIVWPARPNDASSHTLMRSPNKALHELGSGAACFRVPQDIRGNKINSKENTKCT